MFNKEENKNIYNYTLLFLYILADSILKICIKIFNNKCVIFCLFVSTINMWYLQLVGIKKMIL